MDGVFELDVAMGEQNMGFWGDFCVGVCFDEIVESIDSALIGFIFEVVFGDV